MNFQTDRSSGTRRRRPGMNGKERHAGGDACLTMQRFGAGHSRGSIWLTAGRLVPALITKSARTLRRSATRLSKFAGAEGSVYSSLITLIALSLVLGLLGIANHDLWSPDEPRVAGIGHEMWKTGSWWVPRLSGRAFLEQPPFFYLSEVAVYSGFGAADASLARLPSVVYSLLSVVLTVLLGARFFSKRACVWSGFVLLTMWTFIQSSHCVIVDSALLFGVVGAIACFAHGEQAMASARTRWMAGTGAFLAIAFFSKGLVGTGIPGIAIVTYLVCTGRFRAFVGPLLMMAAGMALLAALWLWGVWVEEGVSGLHNFLLQNQLARFLPNVMPAEHVQPFYYYLLTAPQQVAPWSPMAVLASVCARRHWHHIPESERAGLRWIACVLLPNFIVLSIAGTKRGFYLLPLAPCAALLVGWFLDCELPRGRWERLLETGCRQLLSNGAALLPAAPLLLGRWELWPWLVVCAGIAAFTSWFEWDSSAKGLKAWPGAFLALAVAIGCVQLNLPPVLDRERNLQPAVHDLDRIVPHGSTLCAYRPSEVLRGLIAFYTERSLCIVDDAERLRSLVSRNQDVWLIVEESRSAKSEATRRLNSAETAGTPPEWLTPIWKEGGLEVLRIGEPSSLARP
jgi:4-amino-4-deoxy-L-arabinose transferase-like glycosyltransferase